MGRCWLPRKGQKVGRGSPGRERRGCTQAANKARLRAGSQGLGGRVGQGGQGGGLAEVDAAGGFSGLAEEVGGGAHLRVDLPNRRMAKYYEWLCDTGESFVYAAMTRLMVRRLARA